MTWRPVGPQRCRGGNVAPLFRAAKGLILATLLVASWVNVGPPCGAAVSDIPSGSRVRVPVKGSGIVMTLSVKMTFKPIAAPVTEFKPLVVGQPVEVGQQIIADETGAAVIAFPGTTIRMERGSTLVLVKDTNGLVAQVKEGAVYVLTRGEQQLAFATPHGEVVGLGSEYEIRVVGDRTTITVMEGAAAIQSSGLTNRLRLEPNEQGTIRPGQVPQKQAIRAENVMQWWLYYPGVIDTDELPLSPPERAALAEPLQAYRAGDFLQAYRQMPPPAADNSVGQRLFHAAVLLGLGDIVQGRQRLAELGVDAKMPLATALRTLIAAVAREMEEQPPVATTASEWVALSYWHQARHELGMALEAARKATEQSPEFGFAWARVAELEFGHGRTRAAERAIQRSVALSPRHAPAQALRGFVAAAQNRIDDAIGAFNAALDLDHRLGDAWLGLGLCRIRRGELEAGREDLKAAVLVEPNRALLRSYLGKAFGESKRWFGAGRQITLATNELAMAMQLDPNDPTPWLYRALLAREQNRINSAVDDLERSIELNDNRALYRSRLLLDEDKAVRSSSLANVYQSAGMNEVAVREAVKAVDADYANYSAHQFLSESYNALRDPTRFNLRYETVWFNELLLANILSPVGGTPLSQNVSQQEYSRLFEHDRIGLATDASYRSDGQYRVLASQFGTVDNLGWSLDLDYQHNNGVRPNNLLDRLEWYSTVKLQLAPSDSVLLFSKYQQFHSGDNFQYLDPAQASRTFEADEAQEPLLLVAYHREWAPGVHTLLSGARLINDQRVSAGEVNQLLIATNTAGQATNLYNFLIDNFGNDVGGLDLHYRSQLTIYSMEWNQILQYPQHTDILGARYQTGEFQTRNLLDDVVPAIGTYSNAFGNPAASDRFEEDFERLSIYGYHTWQPVDHLHLTAGLAYDRLTFPENYRDPPLSAGTDHRDQLSPKAAVAWRPLHGLTLRGAYMRSLGGVSFDESFRLEPTQLAGFSQAFRTVIPESVAGSVSAPLYDTAGAAVDLALPCRLYLGGSVESIRSQVERTVGGFAYDTSFAPGSIAPSHTRESLDFSERSVLVTANQLLSDEWAVGLSYRLSRSELERAFDQVSRLAVPRSYERADLHDSQALLLFNHPSGFFARWETHWYVQDNSNYPDEDFFQHNVFVGYRLWQRRVELSTGILNLTAQDYRLNPLSVYAELPRERVFVGRIKVLF